MKFIPKKFQVNLSSHFASIWLISFIIIIINTFVLKLISHKADINSLNIHGNSPLHYACHFGFSDLCFELIKLGASVNNCNRYNLTPMDLCRKSLRELLLNLARSYNLPTNRVVFKEDSQWRLSRNKSSKFKLFLSKI